MVTAVLSEVVGPDHGEFEGQHRPPWCFIDRSVANARAKDYYQWKLLAGIGWRLAATVVCTIGYILIQFYVIRKVSQGLLPVETTGRESAGDWPLLSSAP